MSGAVPFANAQHPSIGNVPLAEIPRRSILCPTGPYDALVYGQGPAAFIFAIQMVRHRKTVLLVPSLIKSSQKPWGETLAPRGEFLLGRLGLVNECLAGQHSTQTVLSCWQNSDPERTDLAFDPHGRMWHVNRSAFDNALQAHAIKSGVDILDRRSHCVTSVSRRTGCWEVRLASPDCERDVKIGYVVDATGRSSCVARRMGSKRILRDHLVAVSCTSEEAGEIVPLLIEPVSKGWWYSLGLPQGKLLVALMTDPKLVKVSAEMRKSLWDETLDDAPHTRKRIGARENALSVVGAESARLDSMSGEGWLAIGDAAMSFDPLSSHGLCNAIEQAIDAAEVLSAHGHEAALVEFEAKRKDMFEKYRAQRLDFYQSVRRFSGYAFWQNRILH